MGGKAGGKKAAQKTDAAHPIDASGVLQAAKDGSFSKFAALLKSQKQLTFEDFNSLPPGRSFGVVHQVAFHGDVCVCVCACVSSSLPNPSLTRTSGCLSWQPRCA